ncbi:diguanylate cyclase (GGDEF)-like protein/PAS domain S-box-containing protein [Kibdelosporangium banguiense]|uniref:Diguanylate cyclase (GGDEF)-like protein/PAS domain S-box-containing protein n=1 Tax=Kibdelosporangium banguiense TaxID=1365924 RepID=A0ABS4TF80_9PSEU|nr:EAL domain-containing protein [Kibdelosporangium banguiense]MBP2323077.1 diguanylate cyclase (GGDEF)-like protein/PAS domain S-box-containing protein [Kibdelosporangium banguiense]
MPELRHSPDVPEPRDEARARLILARKWAYVMQDNVFLSIGVQELELRLSELLEVICAVVRTDPFDPSAAAEAGARLVQLGCTNAQALPCTMDVLGKGLLALPEFQPVDRFAEPIVLGLGAMASGFAEANRMLTFEQQENMKLSLLKAVRDAKWQVRESEARFDEVAMSSASGIIITDPEGRLLRTNGAIAGILGHSSTELTGLTLFDLVDPDLRQVLRDDYQDLLTGRKERIKQPQRLLRKDGEIARITLTASVLRGDGDRPSHFVTVIEDGTELMLLQGELNRQALHDVLTGLPNRQYFSTHVEIALRRANPEFGVTLFHLDLDAFAMICNGLGRRIGDHLLVSVSQRLRGVLASEKAMVARFDGDEFGILVENTASTPAVSSMVAKFNEELAEPVYVDGHGVAVSASIGVVHRPPANSDPAELLQAADFALRRAKAAGRGQWELFHADQDARDRQTYTLAAAMPGAWEIGEITVVYRPVAELATGRIVFVEALLRWDRPEVGTLHHEEIVGLAEQTGLILPLGEWLLQQGGRQAGWWRQRTGRDLPLLIGLTAHQSTDADLVSRVLRKVEGQSHQLIVGIPVTALRASEAADNLGVLADMGIQTMLDDFGTAPDELASLEDVPATYVRFARRLVERQALSPVHAPLTAALTTSVPLVHRAGAKVIVDGVHTQEQADWWRMAGADYAIGALSGPACPPGDLAVRLSPE